MVQPIPDKMEFHFWRFVLKILAQISILSNFHFHKVLPLKSEFSCTIFIFWRFSNLQCFAEISILSGMYCSRVLASKWKYLPDQRECPDLNRSTGELVQIKISQLFTKYLESLNCFKILQMSQKQKSALFIPFCLCICILEVSFSKKSDGRIFGHHLRSHVSGCETFCLRKWFKILNLIRSYWVFWNTDKKVV